MSKKITVKCCCGLGMSVFQSNLKRYPLLKCFKCRKIIREKKLALDKEDLLTKNSWRAMIGRCHDSKNEKYRWYGAVGISVCDEWRSSFSKFLSDMGKRPGKEFTVDRTDSSAGYNKDNCRWATKSQQSFNKESTRKILLDDENLVTISSMCAIHDVKPQTARARIRKGVDLVTACSLKSTRSGPMKWVNRIKK